MRSLCSQIYRDRRQQVGARGWGAGRKGEVVFMRAEFVWDAEKVLEMVVAMVVQQRECSERLKTAHLKQVHPILCESYDN